MALKFVNLPKSKQFNIGTRFYDPRKEAMKEREERIKKELESGRKDDIKFSYAAGIKGSFRDAAKRNSRTVSEARRKSNMRLLYIIIILSILFYIILK